MDETFVYNSGILYDILSLNRAYIILGMIKINWMESNCFLANHGT